MQASDACITDIKRWEEFVPYPYDDKVPKLRIGAGTSTDPVSNKLQYVEWTGGPVKGTITIGYGHTNTAGAPKISFGMKVTEAEASEILRNDLAPVELAVNRAVKVEIAQHQYDALVSMTYNCPSALPKIAALINAGNANAVPAKMLQYVCSKGERMQGLVNRRNAEIALWSTPDDPEVAEVHETFSPKAEQEPPPRTVQGSKTIAAGATIGSGGALVALQAANDAAEPIKAARDNLHELGLIDLALASYHSPWFWVGIAVFVCGAFVIWDRNRKRVEAHV